ncbi:zinc finger and BTB domain-containing protein 24-like isoform X2 [Anopheles moucheti]|uniref:zinc finger and BTB domain-containing protein 24-like isoform X2 n=1 Tax=Anopheles moucheti TaxID=186751 RepID=UPI0022F05FBC|nr:zinc finger and BTB domain-containing protein 24-like isoform X2 [Anopheles moucheti]
MDSCRLCMKLRGVKPMNVTIVRKIEVCFGIHINLEDSTLPRNICRRCTKRVNMFKEYRDFYLAVQAKLFISRSSRFLRVDMQPLVQVILSRNETPRYIHPRTQPGRDIGRRRGSNTDTSSSDSEYVGLGRPAQPTGPQLFTIRPVASHIITARRVMHSPRPPPNNRPSEEPTVPRQRTSPSPVADRRPSLEVADPSTLWHTGTSADVKSELSNEPTGMEGLETVEQVEVSLSEDKGTTYAAIENMEMEVLETDVQSQGEAESLEDLTNMQEQQNADAQQAYDLIPDDDSHQSEYEDEDILDSVDKDVNYQALATNNIANVETTESLEAVDNVVDQNTTRPAQETRRRRRNKISGRELYKSLLTECYICGKKVERNRLEGHINRHSGRRPYSCPIEGCSSRFHCKHACRLHVRCRHGSETFTCGTCGKEYKARRDLLGHIRETHVEPRFNCDICGKLFTTRSRLKQHRFYHTGERNYPCHVCEMRFYSNFQLKVHMRTHTKSFPFVCSVCNKSFRYRHMAKEHVVKDHGIDNTLQKEWVIQYPEPDPEEVEVVNTERNIVRYNIQRLEESEEKEELDEGGEGVTIAYQSKQLELLKTQ